MWFFSRWRERASAWKVLFCPWKLRYWMVTEPAGAGPEPAEDVEPGAELHPEGRPCGGCACCGVCCGGWGEPALGAKLGLKYWQTGLRQRISDPDLRAPGVPQAGHFSPPRISFRALKNPIGPLLN